MIYWYFTRYAKQQGTVTVSSVAFYKAKQLLEKDLPPCAPGVSACWPISCLIIALARPQTRNDEELKMGEGIDIVLCLDVSGSMAAQDLLPNRLEASKALAADFVDLRPTDRIGVVIFSGESFTLVPLTTDKEILKSQIFNIQRGALEDGTAIGDGLGVSVDRLKNSPAKTKIIILLTDGENQGGLIGPLVGKEAWPGPTISAYTASAWVQTAMRRCRYPMAWVAP